MPKIYKYQKVTNQFTTYTAVDNDEEDKRITELGTIDGETYISVPDDVILPKQPEQITLEPVTINDELKEQIEKASPHIQLIKKRITDKIREKYSLEEELKIIRNMINDKEKEKFTDYNNFVEACIAEGKVKKEALVKLESPIEPIK